MPLPQLDVGSESGLMRPLDSDELDEDEAPPPTPLWSNIAPESGGSLAAGRVDSPGKPSRQWRGLRGRRRAAQRIALTVSTGLDRLDDQISIELASFLTSLAEDGTLAMERRVAADDSMGGPPPSFMAGPVLPFTGCLYHTSRLFSLPMTESVALDLLATFARRQLPPKSFVKAMLRSQIALLRALPNVPEYEVPIDCAMAVVGDLHGQLEDLMHIFRSNGLPSASRPYLFNGDFVDRGECGVEVTLALFAWQQLHPGSVHLNRGNHEERSVHALYGFQRECMAKYDADVYELFSEAFEHLPLATLVNGQVLILHGGVDPDMTLEGLASLPRADYAVNLSNAAASSGSASRRALVHPAMRARMAEVERREAALRPINSALWNDPMRAAGTMHNKHRGTGLLFGADVVRGFCERTGVALVLRSHEQVLEGFEWPFGSGELLATIFSASNYAGKTRNKGAYALLGCRGSSVQDRPFSLLSSAADRHSIGGAEASLRPSRAASHATLLASSSSDVFSLSEGGASANAAGLSNGSSASAIGGDGGCGDGTAGMGAAWCRTFPFGVLRFVQWDTESIPELAAAQRNAHQLGSLVFSRRDELLHAYAAADKRREGVLPLPLWAAETQRVVRVPFSLLKIRHALGVDAATVDYTAFLSRFALARPQLAPLFPIKGYLLALLHRLDEDASGEVSVLQLGLASAVLRGCFGAHAPLCESPEQLLAALGPAGDEANVHGRVSIQQVADLFRVSHPDKSCPASLVELMHRYDRDEIVAVANPTLYESGSPTRGSVTGLEQMEDESSPEKLDREERIARLYSGLVDSQRGSAGASAENSEDWEGEQLMQQ